MIKWKLSSAKMTGTIHAEEKVECQDMVQKSIKDDVAYVTMSDGAGSAPRALDGALCTVMEVMRNLSLRGLSLFEFSTDEIKNILLSNLRDKLNEKASELGCEFKDLSCTLCFFMSDGRRYLAGNLGDGLVGKMDKYGEYEVILEPERGRYANQSYFVTGENTSEHLRVQMGLYESDSVYFLMTDGSCDCLYNTRKGIFAPALGTFCGWIRKYHHQAVSNSIKETMCKWFSERTGDDCALALVVVDSGNQ